MLAYRLPHSLKRVSYKRRYQAERRSREKEKREKRGLDCIHGFADILWALDLGNVMTDLVP